MKRKLLAIILLIGGLLAFGHTVHAQGGKILDNLGWTASVSSLPQPQDPRNTIIGVIRSGLGLLGIIFFVMIIYAGFLRFTAGGNEEQVSKSNTYFFNAFVGLIIVLSSYSITIFAYRVSTASIGNTCTTNSQCKQNTQKCNIYGKCVDVAWCETSADCTTRTQWSLNCDNQKCLGGKCMCENDAANSLERGTY